VGDPVLQVTSTAKPAKQLALVIDAQPDEPPAAPSAHVHQVSLGVTASAAGSGTAGTYVAYAIVAGQHMSHYHGQTNVDPASVGHVVTSLDPGGAKAAGGARPERVVGRAVFGGGLLLAILCGVWSRQARGRSHRRSRRVPVMQLK
jgi:hypothetical protein